MVRQSLSSAGHKVCNALQTGQLHVIAILFLSLLPCFLCRRRAGKQPFNHKLQKSVLCRQLGSAAKGNLPDPVDTVSFLPVFSRKAHRNMVFSQPLQKAYKTGIQLPDIRCSHTVLLLKFKRSSLYRIGKDPARMMRPLSLPVIQNQNRLLW